MLDHIIIRNFFIALLIGALVGVEREKRKAGKDFPGVGGLRTFIFFAELGAISAWLTTQMETPVVFVSAFLVSALLIIVGYYLQGKSRPGSIGMTTELAAIVVYLLGGMVIFGPPELAVCLAIITATLLAYKQPLHALIAKIGWDDIFTVLRLLIASFIILPLLPDSTFDPWAALNPYRLWLLVVFISGLSLAGYVATRLFGAGKGTAFTGLTGGIVSSTAVTLNFAKRSKEATKPSHVDALACGICLAWGVMFFRIVAEISVVNFAFLPFSFLPFTAMACIACACAWWYYRKSVRGNIARNDGKDDLHLRNPFSLTEAIKFAAFFAVIKLAVNIVSLNFPGSGVLIVAALAGLTDVDAITLSMAELAKSGQTDLARSAIVIAAITNTLVKLGFVCFIGNSALRKRLLISTGLILLVGFAALKVAL